MRFVVMGALVAATWVICSLVSGQATAHAAEQPKVQSSLLGSNDPEPSDPNDQAQGSGLLGGLVGRVTNLVSKPVTTVTEPVREALPPSNAGAGDSTVPVVGDLLPQPAGTGDAEPAHTMPAPAQHAVAGPTLTPPAPEEQAQSGTNDPVVARTTPASTPADQAGLTAAPDTVSGGFAKRLAKQAAALGLGSSLPLPDPDHQPAREPAPASPAPPAPTVKFSSAQSGGGSERDMIATLPRTDAANIAVGIASEHTERAQRGPATPGLPAISPD